MTLTEFLKTISEELGDQPDGGGPLSWQRWSPSLLAAYFQEGQCLLASLSPDDYTEVKDIKLNTGSLQQLGDCCPKVLAVTEQVDASGATVARLDLAGPKQAATKVDWTSRWQGSSCATTGTAFKLGSARKDPSSANVFTVSPPVPQGTDVYVRVLCGGVAPATTPLTGDVGACKNLAALRAFVLSSAMSSQIESAYMQSSGRDHFQRFMALTKYSIEREDASSKKAGGNGS